MVELYLENGEKADLHDVIVWWLAHYEGLEHMTEGGTTSPETWYTINSILRRALQKVEKREGNTMVKKEGMCVTCKGPFTRKKPGQRKCKYCLRI